MSNSCIIALKPASAKSHQLLKVIQAIPTAAITPMQMKFKDC